MVAMPDFFLEPDEIEPERPARSGPVHLVSGGLHPTAEVPTSKRQDPPPVVVPCEACGTMVVRGATVSGVQLALDLHLKTYTINRHHEAHPVLHESRGYPVHRCPGLEVQGGP
jgi:hypothetical protein